MPNDQDYQVEMIPMEEIYSDDDFNCRGHIAPIDVVDLARSIQETGLQFPIAVQPYNHPTISKIKYRIVAGHRRYAAFRVNKLAKIPAMIKTGLSEAEARLMNLTENLKREALNIVQEAHALEPFKRLGWGQDMIAAKTGTSRGWVQVRMLLLKLPPPIQAEAAAGLITQEQIRVLASLPTAEEQYEAVKVIKDRREKGDSVKLPIKPKEIKPMEKKERKVHELVALQEHIQEQVGNNIITRVLGWATGYVSNAELHMELRDYFKEEGETYRYPKALMDGVMKVK